MREKEAGALGPPLPFSPLDEEEELRGAESSSGGGQDSRHQLEATVPSRKVAEHWRPLESGYTTAQAAGGRRGRYPIAISLQP